MTLNATIFPDLGIPTIAVDFTRLALDNGQRDELARDRMGFYSRMLDRILSDSPAWQHATTRIVVGHSFGGMLALDWLTTAAQHPLRRVDGLLLASTTAGPMFDVARLRVVGPDVFRIPVRPLLPFWYHPFVTRTVARLTGSTTASGSIDFQALRWKADIAVGLAGWRNTNWQSRRAYRVAMEGFDVRDRLGRIDVPAIVLHGMRDTFFSVEVARDLASRLPRGELRVVMRAAHTLPLTHGASVTHAVTDLL